MRKTIFAVIMTALMAICLAACGGSPAETDAGSAAETEAGLSAVTDDSLPGDTSEAEEAAIFEPEAGEPVAVSSVKIGLMCAEDENFANGAAHIKGLSDACGNLGVSFDTQCVIMTNVPEDETCYSHAVELAEAGCNIVFSNARGHQSYLQQAAVEYPEVTFVVFGGDLAELSGLSNYKNAFPRAHESSYVSGIVAGMKLAEMIAADSSVEPQIGYVGTFSDAQGISAMTSFFLGARAIVPEARMDVQYTNARCDQAAETAAAESLISGGCVILGQHTDTAGAAAAVQAAHQNGSNVYCVGCSEDMSSAAPDVVLTSVQNNWQVLYKFILSCLIDGEVIPFDYAAGADQDAVAITELGAACAEGTQSAVDAAWQGIENGTIQVFDTTAFKCGASVDGSYTTDSDGRVISAFALDTDGDAVNDSGEAIVDEAFIESELRSAPYFSLRIDGIAFGDGS